MARNAFNFDLVLTNFKRNELNVARQIANAQRAYYVDAFKRQSWGGKRWKQVKRRIPGTNEYKYPKKKGLSRRVKPILQLSGALRRAVNNSVKSVSVKGTRMSIPLKYAKIHNEGGVAGNGARIPKRQYMGFNGELDRIIKKIITQSADKNFKTR